MQKNNWISIKKYLLLVRKNALKFGLFVYISTVVIYLVQGDLSIKILLVTATFSILFGLYSKVLFTVSLFTAVTNLLFTQDANNSIGLFFMGILGVCVIEVVNLFKPKTQELMRLFKGIFTREKMKNTSKKLKDIFIEP